MTKKSYFLKMLYMTHEKIISAVNDFFTIVTLFFNTFIVCSKKKNTYAITLKVTFVQLNISDYQIFFKFN